MGRGGGVLPCGGGGEEGKRGRETTLCDGVLEEGEGVRGWGGGVVCPLRDHSSNEEKRLFLKTTVFFRN